MSEAEVTIASAGAFLVLLALLHVLKPELDPSWRLISEYECGGCGWLMRLAFVCLSISCFALVVALRRFASAVGEASLTVVAIGVLGGGFFLTDPITTPRSEMSLAGRLHALFGSLFVLGFPIAATIIGRDLVGNQTLAPARRWLPWLSLLSWLGLITFMRSVYRFTRQGREFGPRVRLGWSNRFMVLTYIVWLVVVAWLVG